MAEAVTVAKAATPEEAFRPIATAIYTTRKTKKMPFGGHYSVWAATFALFQRLIDTAYMKHVRPEIIQKYGQIPFLGVAVRWILATEALSKIHSLEKKMGPEKLTPEDVAEFIAETLRKLASPEGRELIKAAVDTYYQRFSAYPVTKEGLEKAVSEAVQKIVEVLRKHPEAICKEAELPCSPEFVKTLKEYLG